MKRNIFYLSIVISMILTACASLTGVGTTPPAAATEAATMQTLPSNTPEPSCPEPTEGTQLLAREEMGYCLLYPEGYTEVDTEPAQVCLVPGSDTSLACHSANAFINVEPANGRTANQAADQIVADSAMPEPVERTSLTIGGEEAVLLDGLGGVDINRRIVIVHNNRLYTLMFTPWDETREEWPRLEALYDTLTSSFTFLP